MPTAATSDDASSPTREADYEAPRLDRLGTLAQLTLGGGAGGPDDGWDGAGDEGSLS